MSFFDQSTVNDIPHGAMCYLDHFAGREYYKVESLVWYYKVEFLVWYYWSRSNQKWLACSKPRGATML